MHAKSTSQANSEFRDHFTLAALTGRPGYVPCRHERLNAGRHRRTTRLTDRHRRPAMLPAIAGRLDLVGANGSTTVPTVRSETPSAYGHLVAVAATVGRG
jgi:hypothetical protein